MRRLLSAILLLASVPLLAADSWLYGRIADVQKSVNTRTQAWVVNTPITEDEVTYILSVHVGDRLLTGSYQPTSDETPPPEEWTTNYPVKVLVVGDVIEVRGPTGDVRAHINKRKAAKMMLPLTADEKKGLEQMEAPSRSMIGFESKSEESSAAGAKSAEVSQPAPAPPSPQPLNAGTVTVRSTPYLSEVFVDGDSMGYTPAKINLPPGKHTFRVEKSGYAAWTKEMTITVGSELTLDATLQRK